MTAKRMEKGKNVESAGKKSIFAIGKRKRAIARAWLTQGKGRVKINDTLLEHVGNEIARMRMEEPLTLAGNGWKKFDIHVSVHGGGTMGQAEAVRQAISRSIVSVLPEAKETFLTYDRFLLVYDPRRTEPHKPPRSSQGARRYKQRSKR